MKNLVFYDCKDNDGRGSLAIFSKFTDIEFIAVGLDRGLKDINGDFYIDVFKDILNRDSIQNVYFLDLAPRNEIEFKSIKKTQSNIIIIDHHILPYNVTEATYIFNNKYSASALTYFYFKNIDYNINHLPYIVKLINDRDTFTRNYKESDYLHNTFNYMSQDELNDIILSNSNNWRVQTWLNLGLIKQVGKNRRKEIAKKEAKIGELLSNRIIYINHEIDSDILSEVGNELCIENDVDFFIVCKYDKDNKNYLYSLRSLNNQALKFIRDNNFKGGGHNNACGFIHDINILDNIKKD